jgi:hypothetical protein
MDSVCNAQIIDSEALRERDLFNSDPATSEHVAPIFKCLGRCRQLRPEETKNPGEDSITIKTIWVNADTVSIFTTEPKISVCVEVVNVALQFVI